MPLNVIRNLIKSLFFFRIKKKIIFLFQFKSEAWTNLVITCLQLCEPQELRNIAKKMKSDIFFSKKNDWVLLTHKLVQKDTLFHVLLIC